MTFRSSFHCFERPKPLFISLSVGNNNGEASFIVHLPLMNAVKVWCDDVYTSQVYFLTTHYCYQSIEFNDMLSQIRRLNTLLFNVRKNLPSVHTENNSASVIGHAGCRRHICDMIGWGGLFHLQPLLRGWPPAAHWQAAASSCCCSSLAMLPSSRWWRLAFDRRSGKWFIVVLS